MNINKKIAAGVIAGTLGVTTVFGVAYTTASNRTEALVSTNGSVIDGLKNAMNLAMNQTADTSTTATTVSNDTNEKEETVYIKADASGNVSNVIVSDWIKNYKGDAAITDKTTLSDIVNVKGDETFTQGENGEIVWQANGNDIYYQGTTQAELPVAVHATYKLDGTEIQPADLVGKSGELTIEYTYDNKSKMSGSNTYTPFTVLATTSFTTDHFAKVKAENAKVISDGDKYVIVGLAMPGLKDSLDLGKDTKVPESITITAEVTDYEPITVLNVVTADLLNNIKLDDTDKLTDLASSLDDLSEASKKLVDGSSDLSSGLTKLADKTSEYTDGVSTLTTGVDAYIEGVSKVSDGIKTLYDSSDKLTSGASALADGAKTLHSGLKEAKKGVDSVAENMTKLSDGASKLKDGASSLNDALTKLTAGKEKENEAYATLTKTVENNEKIIAALEASGADPSIVKMLKDNTAGQKALAEGLTKSGTTIAQGLSQSASGASDLSSGADTLSTGLSKMKTGSSTLKGAMKQLVTGSESVETGAKELSNGIDTLSTGVTKLYNGSSELGKASSKLSDGASKLNDAGGQLKAGANTAADGGKTLAEGMSQFDREGITKLVSAVDGNLQDILDKVDDLKGAAKNYTTFTDSSTDMNSSVKFIIELH
jgi:putative membrane protein